MHYASSNVAEFLAVAALALRNLIFMMREDQILAACMDVDLLAQILLGHNGALDMPARTALAPRVTPRTGSPSFFGFQSTKSSGSSFSSSPDTRRERLPLLKSSRFLWDSFP